MSDSKTCDESQRCRHAFWNRLGNGRRRFYAGISLFVAGIIFWGGFNAALEATNTEAFCVSCHEMRENVLRDYEMTAHYKNRTGVRATCTDCHLPRPWVPRIVRKLASSKVLLHKLSGTVATKEKFAARRLELAQRVWRDMAATDSRECRNCHSFAYMNLDKQDASVRKNHSVDIARESGKTCIDCHKGVAHVLPKGGMAGEPSPP